MFSSSQQSKDALVKKAEEKRQSFEECYKEYEGNPVYQKALAAYDALVKKLKEASNTDDANKVFEELEEARAKVQSAYEEAKNAPPVHSVLGTAAEYGAAAKDKTVELGTAAKDKAAELGHAAAEKLAEAKQKLVG